MGYKQLGAIIKTFLAYLNKRTDKYILKGGTALFYCRLLLLGK
jgi:predicted nucleotidyltransferase component of viral defense system